MPAKCLSHYGHINHCYLLNSPVHGRCEKSSRNAARLLLSLTALGRLRLVIRRFFATVFPLIEAGSLTEAWGLKANIIELIAHPHVALWCIASFVRIA